MLRLHVVRSGHSQPAWAVLKALLPPCMLAPGVRAAAWQEASPTRQACSVLCCALQARVTALADSAGPAELAALVAEASGLGGRPCMYVCVGGGRAGKRTGRQAGAETGGPQWAGQVW